MVLSRVVLSPRPKRFSRPKKRPKEMAVGWVAFRASEIAVKPPFAVKATVRRFCRTNPESQQDRFVFTQLEVGQKASHAVHCIKSCECHEGPS